MPSTHIFAGSLRQPEQRAMPASQGNTRGFRDQVRQMRCCTSREETVTGSWWTFVAC
jgi:hypothetical protein